MLEKASGMDLEEVSVVPQTRCQFGRRWWTLVSK